jgi:uncharacterized protein (TIGR02246 family)
VPDTQLSSGAQHNRALSAEAACRDLVHGYFACIDAGKATTAVDLFTETAVMEAAGRMLEGRGAISAALGAREANQDRRTRHVVTNLVVHVDGDGRASARATLLVFVLSGKTPTLPSLLSELHVEFVEEGGAWKVANHSSRRLAEQPSS